MTEFLAGRVAVVSEDARFPGDRGRSGVVAVPAVEPCPAHRDGGSTSAARTFPSSPIAAFSRPRRPAVHRVAFTGVVEQTHSIGAKTAGRGGCLTLSLGQSRTMSESWTNPPFLSCRSGSFRCSPG